MVQFSRVVRNWRRWMWRHKKLRLYVLGGLGGIIVAVVIAQLAYPAGRTLPFVEIQGQPYGSKSITDGRKQLDKQYQQASLELHTATKVFKPKLEEAGIDVASTKTMQAASEYSFAQRLIPFSSVAIMAKRDTPISVDIDSDRLHYFAEQVHAESSIAAVNASVKVDGSNVVLVPSKPSREYPVESVMKDIKAASFNLKTTKVQAKATMQPAARKDAEVQAVLSEAQKAVDTPLVLTVGADKTTVDKATIGTWLDFNEDKATMQLTLTTKKDVVKQYLSGIQSKVYKAPGVTKVSLVDGREAARVDGAAGQGIDMDKTINMIDQAIVAKTSTNVAVPITTLAARVEYTRDYSNSQAGLNAMVNDLASAKGGYGISVREVGGRSWNASANGGKQFVAASTYKLYVAYSVLKRMESGEMKWSDTINGKSAEACFEAMIVRSDNPCAKAFGDKVGWQTVEDEVRGLGMTNTELSPNLLTTANDLTLFMSKLEGGSLVSGESRSRLLDAMKRQIYRQGVPAGAGVSVADKVGFVDGYIHDAAIVYSPRGTYVITIMTKGSSWGSIADATKQIHAFLNR